VSQFIVDGSSLDALGAELGQLHTRLLAAPSLVSGFEGLLGGDNMDQAVQDFCTSWHHAVGVVAGEIDDLMGGLQQAAHAYQEIDDRVRQRAMSGWLGAPKGLGGRPGGDPVPAQTQAPASPSGGAPVGAAPVGGTTTRNPPDSGPRDEDGQLCGSTAAVA
jgi:hypothetical protein